MFHNNSYRNTHPPAFYPVYILPCNTAVHDWIKQANSLGKTKSMMTSMWQEKPDDFASARIIGPHYNYPKQKKINDINPKDYYSLS